MDHKWSAAWVAGCTGIPEARVQPDAGPAQMTSNGPGLDVKIAPFDVPPGGEVQNCFYLKIPSDTDLDLGKVIIDFAQGTHHMHVYYGDEQHDDGMEECFTAVDFDKWHLLVGAQKPHLEWELPPKVAFHVKAHQQLLIQVHFVNAATLTTTNNQAQGMIHFDTRPATEVQSYMGSIFGQQRAIDIKPFSKLSVDGICKLPHDLNMGALAGHYHFKGQDFVASRLNADGSADTPFYRTENFAEPKFELYGERDPLRFSAGERILWHCDYDNQSNLEIPFGPKELTQEHCNMFAFYYPAMGQQEFTPCVAYGRCSQPCASDETCSDAGECVKSQTCTPSCTGKVCGDDGCGHSCGTCADGTTCTAAGQCMAASCVPACAGKVCGDDGCSHSCGTCTSGATCTAAGQCQVVAQCGSETESNDKSTHSNGLCAGTALSGTISTAADVDWFTFTLSPGDHHTVTLSSLPADYTFSVYHLAASGSINKLNDAIDDGDLKDQVLTSTSVGGGDYLVKVHSAAGASDAARPYQLLFVKN